MKLPEKFKKALVKSKLERIKKYRYELSLPIYSVETKTRLVRQIKQTYQSMQEYL